MVYWFGVLITFLAAYLIFRVIVRKDYLKHGKLGLLSTTLEFIIFALHANLIYLHLPVPWPQLPPLPDNRLSLYLGGGIVILGLLATLGIMAYLGFGTTIGQQPDEIRQSGPYRWTRNPQLLTYGIILAGFGIMYPSFQVTSWILLYVSIGYMMVITEEEHLLNLFGDSYREYCKKVPRFIIHWQPLESGTEQE